MCTCVVVLCGCCVHMLFTCVVFLDCLYVMCMSVCICVAVVCVMCLCGCFVCAHVVRVIMMCVFVLGVFDNYCCV